MAENSEKWEYCKVRYSADGAWVYIGNSSGFTQRKGYKASGEYKDLEALNELGREGWELVSMVQVGQLMYIIAYLKRRLP